MRFTHSQADMMGVGDFINVIATRKDGEMKCIITSVGIGWFEATRWRWWHEVMWWNPCNPIELVTGDVE